MSGKRYRSKRYMEAKAAQAESRSRETFLDRYGLLMVGAALLVFIGGGLYLLAHRSIDPATAAFEAAVAACVKDRTRAVDTSGTQVDPTSDCIRETPLPSKRQQ